MKEKILSILKLEVMNSTTSVALSQRKEEVKTTLRGD